ncbi:MAG TPA: TonB-dependent receptor [Ignavibacteria bacterium]|nr:TonB-dependent receptor [Ignavibacteria bacterium]
MRILIFIFLILSFTSAYSQTEPDNNQRKGNNLKPEFDDGSVSGYVFDKLSNTPMESATVQLFRKRDSTLAGGAETDAKGFFIINDVAQGKYRLHVSLAGYNKNMRDADVLNASAKDIVTDTIFLNSGTETDEIVVEGEKPYMEMQGEKKIFNVEESMSVKGGSAVDILKNLPSVTVDIDNNVSLRGGSNIKYFINGRPVTGSITRILEQLPADQISSVEVITNPSAKYDAEGSTGVINLVLKEYDDSGINGQLELSTGTQDNYNTGFNLNYKNKDYKVSGYYDGRIATRFFNAAIDRQNFFSTEEAQTDQYSNGRFRSNGNNARVELEFYPTKADVLTFNARYEERERNRGDTDNLTTYDNQNNLFQDYKALNNETETSNGYSLGLNYFKPISKKGHNLTGELSFATDKEYENENKQIDFLFPANLQSIFSIVNGSEINKEFNGQIDYVNKFSENMGFESGIKYNVRNTNTDNYYYTQDTVSKVYLIDTALTDDFSFEDGVGAAYLIYTGQAGDLNYNLGIRGENWNYNLDQILSSSNTSRNIFDIFPSAGISYKLSLSDEIGANYTRKIRRPGYRELSPVTRVFSPVLLSKGNPDLNPEYINSIEFNYAKFFNEFSVIPSLFYKNISDVITRTSVLIDSNVILNVPINANTERSYGAELLLNGMFANSITVNGSVSYFYQDINSDTLGNNSNTTFSGRLFTNFALPFESGLQLTYFYSGKAITPQGTIDPVSSFDVAVSKDFLNDKLNLNLRVSDVFNTTKFSGSSTTSLYTQEFTRARDSRMATLSLTYKFGTDSKSKERKKKRQGNNDGNDSGDMDF